MDIQYLLALQDLRTAAGPVAEQILNFITNFGSGFYPLLVCCIVYYCVDKRAGTLALASSMLATLVCNLVKLVVCCYRPWIRDPRLHVSELARPTATGYSFPSGHSTQAASIYGSLAWWFRRHRAILVTCVALIALVAFSRNYLGCHTPQDVVVGLALGLASIPVARRAIEWAQAGERRDLVLLGASVVIGVIVLLVVALKPYPLDYDSSGALLVDPATMKPNGFTATGTFEGAVAGVVFERRRVGFEDTPSWARKAIRLVPGALVSGAILLFLAPVAAPVMGTLGANLVAGLLSSFVLVAGWPWVFVRIERRLDARSGGASVPAGGLKRE